MAFKYRSFCSGSSGNAALLWTPAAGVLLDFAPGCQRDCRELIAEARKACPTLDTVLVTHAHGDHINANSLKMMRQEGLRAHCHPDVARQARQKYGEEFAPLLRGFTGGLAVGDLAVEQTTVSHAPGYHTSAFIVTAAGRRPHKAAFFTDLSHFNAHHVELARGSDFIFVEANHDPELLARHGHPGSEFHLSNGLAGEFLGQVCEAGRLQPQAVVLGHLSTECNRPQLPPAEIEAAFARRALRHRFALHVADRYEPGPEIAIAARH